MLRCESHATRLMLHGFRHATNVAVQSILKLLQKLIRGLDYDIEKINKDKMVNESFGESSFYFIFSHSCIISVMRQMLHY